MVSAWRMEHFWLLDSSTTLRRGVWCTYWRDSGEGGKSGKPVADAEVEQTPPSDFI
jgi:hypothetical protein